MKNISFFFFSRFVFLRLTYTVKKTSEMCGFYFVNRNRDVNQTRSPTTFFILHYDGYICVGV